MFTYSELQTEVKRSAVRDKGGTEFDVGIKNAINRAINRISRECRWRPLRKQSNFDTVAEYSEGTGAVSVTLASTSVTVTGATFITDGVVIDRRINIGGSSKDYRIEAITGQTTLTLDSAYDGTTSAVQTYAILPQALYNLPIQASHEVILWHEQFGTPYQLNYITTQASLGAGLYEDTTGIPTHYRMWNEDSVITQIRTASVVSVVSSAAADTTQSITVFGEVSGYPDYETIAVTGTTSASGSKSFTSVERIVASNSARTGRITVSANSAEDTLAVLPVGNTTREVKYRKARLYQLPNTAFKMFCYYYKIPYMLVNDDDIHELGSDFDSAIIMLATSIIRGETSQKEAPTWLAMYKDELKSLKGFYLDKIDWLPRLGQSPMFGGNVPMGGMAAPNLTYGQIGTGGMFGPTVGGV